MSLTVNSPIQMSYQGSTAYAGESMNGNAVAVGTLMISDGSASGTYDNVTLYYNPNAKGILGATTGIYYAVADGHTFVNAINSYLQYDGSFNPQSITGSSATVNENVTFTTTPSESNYTVDFNESGLPSGTSWSVTFNGQTLSSTTSQISFTNVPTGSYSFSIVSSGYTANPSSGTLQVG